LSEVEPFDDDVIHFLPDAGNKALFEIRLALWLCFAVLCVIAWRIWYRWLPKTCRH